MLPYIASMAYMNSRFCTPLGGTALDGVERESTAMGQNFGATCGVEVIHGGNSESHKNVI
jgi:hypothetical protein